MRTEVLSHAELEHLRKMIPPLDLIDFFLSGTHSIVGVEDVGGRRVVQDQGLVKVSAQTT